MKPGMIGRGIAAGFVATVVLSAMMLVKHSMGLMPELDPIAMITAMAGANSPALGWIAHFVIGSIFLGYWLRGRQSLPARAVLVAWRDLRRGRVAADDDRDDADGGGWPVRAWSQHDDAGGDVGLAHRLRSGAGRGLWLAPAERCQVATASRIPNHDARVRSTSRSRCREVARLARIRPGSTRRWPNAIISRTGPPASRLARSTA